MMGLSWLALELISSLPPALMSQAQPDPKRVAPAALNFSLKASKLPNVLLMAAARLPVGGPPALGPMISQNMGWLMAPPALLRTAVRMFSGMMAHWLASSCSSVLLWRSGCGSSALFKWGT